MVFVNDTTAWATPRRNSSSIDLCANVLGIVSPTRISFPPRHRQRRRGPRPGRAVGSTLRGCTRRRGPVVGNVLQSAAPTGPSPYGFIGGEYLRSPYAVHRDPGAFVRFLCVSGGCDPPPARRRQEASRAAHCVGRTRSIDKAVRVVYGYGSN